MTTFYNVTLSVPVAIESEWARWMCEVHIPEVLQVPGFIGATMYRVEPLGEPADAQRVQYVNCYRVRDRAILERYLASETAVRLRADHEQLFGAHVTATRCVWEAIAEF